MKRKVEHPESSRELTGPKYWRSLDELAATPGFKAHIEREFPEGASQLEGVDRRQFFKLMAASFALGGVGLAAGCRRPDSYILPYSRSVETIIPGLPLYFATAMPLRNSAIPLLAETHQGRPTKLEGNPTYQPHGGATDLLSQASLLDLYDPDRATTHLTNGSVATVGAIQDKLSGLGKTYGANGGAGLAFLAEDSSSPTRAALVARLKAKFPKAIWAQYEPVVDEPPLEAAQAAFGANVKPLYRFAKAKRVLAIDADFVSAEAGSLYYSREFTKGRRIVAKDSEMNRLYVMESQMTLTGSMADHRLRLASSHAAAFAAAVAAQIPGATDASSVAHDLGAENKLVPAWIKACVADLLAFRGQSLVVAGSHLPASVHALVYSINAALGNIGQTVDFVETTPSSAAGIGELATAIRGGAVKSLVILGGNPAYNAPADLDWPSLQKSVADVIRYGYYVDETSAFAQAHVAAAHYLESWGDARTVDGTIVPVQPMILPLFGGLTEIEVLARILGDATTDPYTLVYQTITGIQGGDAAAAFRRFLHDGLVEGSAHRVAPVRLSSSGVARLLGSAGGKTVTFSKENLEVRFVADHKVDDGRFANNGWLQECPDPITKIAWDNAILISPRLAQELGVYPKGSVLQVARVEEGEIEHEREEAYMAELTLNGRKVKGPLHIQPGLAAYTIVLRLGYGRTVAGHIGKGQGFSAYAVRASGGLHIATGGSLSVLRDERHPLPNVQNHWSMEGRDLIREANLEGPESFREDPFFVREETLEAHSPSTVGEAAEKLSAGERATEIPRGGSLYKTPKFDGIHQWGMSIDLNACTGCNACVVACQAENNIPIVGRDQVLRGRSMHWIRIDRYYSDGAISGAAFGGDENRVLPEEPQVSLQPVACVQCELAPCETVCPVNATVHDDEGINAMAYNRCIGTRYCANNCPYKVRRFNYFDFNKRQLDSFYLGPLGPNGMPELVKMVKNPDVSVRMRGVMEKCTYCVQRIEQAKIAQKVKARDSDRVKIPDGTIKTACQQVCPVEAIVFGDITDQNSAVSKAKARSQDYSLLGYLNTRPRTTYLGRIRNPNPQMPDYDQLPLSSKEYRKKNHPGGESPEPPTHGNAAHPEPSHTSLDHLTDIGGLS